MEIKIRPIEEIEPGKRALIFFYDEKDEAKVYPKFLGFLGDLNRIYNEHCGYWPIGYEYLAGFIYTEKLIAQVRIQKSFVFGGEK